MFKIVQRVEKNNEVKEQPQFIQKTQQKQEQLVPLPRKEDVKKRNVEKINVPSVVQVQTNLVAVGIQMKNMKASLPLIDDKLELLDTIKEFICDTNKKFIVVGAIGSQGTGKSTMLSMLGGNDPMDMYREYIFRPCARETVESCRYQTTKISVYISHKSRTIFIDSQPLNCVPLLEDYNHSYRSKAGPMESLELESLQLLLLLANVCDTILLCIDWFIDLSIIRRLLRIELFPRFLNPNKKNVNLVVLHQRAKAQDFQPILIEERMRLLDEIFSGTFLNIRAGLTMAKLSIPIYEHIKNPTNYIVMPELKPRTRVENYTKDQNNNVPFMEYGSVVSALRTKIITLPKDKDEMTEGKWFSMTNECWNKIKQEVPVMTDDGCTIQRNNSDYTKTEELIQSRPIVVDTTCATPLSKESPQRYGVGGRRPKREWRTKRQFNQKNYQSETKKE